MALLSVVAGAQSLEECQQAAERNYPLIRQYGLIAQTTELTVSNIRKGWLPQVSASAQATLQSDVVSWPEQMQSVYQQMGLDMRGLRKDQYRVGIDVQQMVYDGGAISSQKNIAREQGKVQEAQNEVTMYQVRRRVNEMYFGLLLLDKQIQLNHDLQEVLAANERKLSSMYERGTAAKSDYQTVKAERLNVVQQVSSLQAQRNAVARMQSLFCGLEVKDLEKPQATSSWHYRLRDHPLHGRGGLLRPHLHHGGWENQRSRHARRTEEAFRSTRYGLCLHLSCASGNKVFRLTVTTAKKDIKLMRQFMSFVIKEARHIVRDKRTMLILFGMPTVMVLLFGFAISTDVRNVRTVVVTSQMDHQTQAAVERLSASEYFTIGAIRKTAEA